MDNINWLYTWYFILYVKKFGGIFNICCSFMLCNTHGTCYLDTAVSVWSIYRYNVISFFDTLLNLTISFVYIFSRGFKHVLRVNGYCSWSQFRHLKMFMETMMLSWKFLRPITLVRAPMFLVFVCLFGIYLPTREFFTHMETSPLLVKGCKFWPMLI